MKLMGLNLDCIEEDDYFPSLQDMLNDIVDGDKFYWSILAMDGVGDIGQLGIVELRSLCRNMHNGYILSWKELNNIAKESGQIIDAIFIGSKNLADIRKYKTFRDMFYACDYVFVITDLNNWKIFTNDLELHEKFSKKFVNAKILPFDDEIFCDNIHI